ncbi:MAG: MFS transporter [Candidatus Limnocylindrales bacterium]
MSRRIGTSLSPAMTALRLAFIDGDLRHLMLAWLAVNAGKWAFLVVNLVLAYDAGGAVAIGVLGLARFLIPTILAPFAGLPTIRWRPEHVLRAVNAIRTVAVVAAVGVIAAELPIEALYAVVAVEAGAGAFTRPLHMALLPAVARTPAQLVAANVGSSTAEGLGTFAGPALASVLLVVSGPVAATLVVLVIYVLGVASIARLQVPAVGRMEASTRAAFDQLSAGIRALARFPGPRWIVLDLGFQTFVRGLLTVLVVVASIELLNMGQPGVGTLNAALGLGGIVGALAAIALAGRARLTPAFVVALAGWGAPIILIGLVVHPVAALVAMLAIGISNSLLDVAGFTLVQRLTPNESRVSVLGLLDSVANGGVAMGGIVAPILVEALGIRGALIAAGVVLPIAALATWPLLRQVDEGGAAGARRVDLVHGDPLFAPLSLATVEHLASRLVPAAFADGAWLMREGDPGREYLLIDTGEVAVSRDGQAVRTLGSGSGVGEIALLHDVPRTASVQAVGPVTAFSLDQGAFLEAVTGHAGSQAVATSRVQERLEGDTERPVLH